MHEMSLCQSAVEIIQRQAEQHDVKRVTAVWLEIGALSCVEESAVRFSFEIVCHGTVAQGCVIGCERTGLCRHGSLVDLCQSTGFIINHVIDFT